MENQLRTNSEILNSLTQERLKKVMTDSLPDVQSCSACGNSDYVSVILIGRPSRDAQELAHEGFFKLGGCIMSEDRKNNYCRKCQKSF